MNQTKEQGTKKSKICRGLLALTVAVMVLQLIGVTETAQAGYTMRYAFEVDEWSEVVTGICQTCDRKLTNSGIYVVCSASSGYFNVKPMGTYQQEGFSTYYDASTKLWYDALYRNSATVLENNVYEKGYPYAGIYLAGGYGDNALSCYGYFNADINN